MAEEIPELTKVKLLRVVLFSEGDLVVHSRALEKAIDEARQSLTVAGAE